MCGRCVIFTVDEVLGAIKDIEAQVPLKIEPDWPARRVQAYPNSVAPLIVPRFDTALGLSGLGVGSLGVQEMAWGFDESWTSGVVFNTRIESAAKPTWRESMAHRRCVLPVSSFFETNKNETYTSPKTGRLIKRQYEFRVPGQDVILIGCTWKDNRFSMVTTEANEDMAPIHHRMPLIVRQEELPLWLGPHYRELADRSSIKLDVASVQ
ncbi:MAG: SOS response-associated peptidase [Eggerthellaceae bacterium]|jgi:putative SOS response-associated peptidase YedK